MTKNVTVYYDDEEYFDRYTVVFHDLGFAYAMSEAPLTHQGFCQFASELTPSFKAWLRGQKPLTWKKIPKGIKTAIKTILNRR